MTLLYHPGVKVFLDVGAHLGETLEVVQSPEWEFDRIVCFEPAPACWPRILEHADARAELCRFGLWKADEMIVLHNPGLVGASIAADKDEVAGSATCDFRDAAAWFERNVREADTVFAKINVEGAEVDIIRRLAETGQLRKIDHLLIHFDVRKIASMRHREAEARTDLEVAGVEYLSADEIQFGGVYRGTRNWLRWVRDDPRKRDLRYKQLAQAEHLVRMRLFPLKQVLAHR